MGQDIITYLIIIIAVVAVIIRLVKTISGLLKQKTNMTSGKCSSCAIGCDLKDLAASKNCNSSRTPMAGYNSLK